MEARTRSTYSTAIIIAANDGAVAVYRAVAHIGARMTTVIDMVGWGKSAAEWTSGLADILLVLFLQ